MKNEQAIPAPEQFGLSNTNMVYVRSVRADELGPEIVTPEGVETLYALHDIQGRRLALFDDRQVAFAVARQNDLEAMSVH